MRTERVAWCFLAVAGLLAPLMAPAAMAQSTSFDNVSELARTNVMLAESYLAAGDLSAALERANRAVKRDPKSAEAHAVLALVQDRINRPKQAKSSFERALKLAPDSGAILNAHAVWLCQQGQYEEADAQYQRAMADPLYKSTLLVLNNAARCALAAQQKDAAERYFRGIIEANPAEPSALEALAVLHLEKGDTLRARAFIQRREAVGPASAEMLVLAASIEEAAGADSTAAEYRRRLNREFPDYSPPNPEGQRQP
ncbi:MAG TPA: type IV pilus biogenesis/stability protein PilW [Arenimonas sp.]|nr:type IV pilus biogenesis/stability protein PilW [Arenimonas sp.]